MSDWQVGDLALCVRGGRSPVNTAHADYPACGAVYRVCGVGSVEFNTGESLGLFFDDAPENVCGRRVWNAGRFVKATPPAADEFDREVIEQMTKVPA